MQFRQLFIIESHLLGEAQRSASLRHAELAEPLSYFWFCRKCGDIFARAPVYRKDGTLTEFQAQKSLCRKCAAHQRFFSEFPGSIWLSWDHEFLAALPQAVLAWELERAAVSFETFGGYAT